MEYNHTQRAPLHWFILVPAVAIFSVAWGLRGQPVLFWLQLSVAATLVLVSLMFQRLSVRDAVDHLAVRFGPLGVFGTRIPYDDITCVQRGRSRLIDGWGVHWIPGRGMTYNLWGFDCVQLTVRGNTVRIGSDDAEGLANFLETKIPD